MTSLNLSAAALEDAENIIRYGDERWGRSASLEYLDELFAEISIATTQPDIGRLIKVDNIDVRYLFVSDYYVFYIAVSEEIEVIRLLHGRSNVGHILNIDF